MGARKFQQLLVIRVPIIVVIFGLSVLGVYLGGCGGADAGRRQSDSRIDEVRPRVSDMTISAVGAGPRVTSTLGAPCQIELKIMAHDEAGGGDVREVRAVMREGVAQVSLDGCDAYVGHPATLSIRSGSGDRLYYGNLFLADRVNVVIPERREFMLSVVMRSAGVEEQEYRWSLMAEPYGAVSSRIQLAKGCGVLGQDVPVVHHTGELPPLMALSLVGTAWAVTVPVARGGSDKLRVEFSLDRMPITATAIAPFSRVLTDGMVIVSMNNQPCTVAYHSWIDQARAGRALFGNADSEVTLSADGRKNLVTSFPPSLDSVGRRLGKTDAVWGQIKPFDDSCTVTLRPESGKWALSRRVDLDEHGRFRVLLEDSRDYILEARSTTGYSRVSTSDSAGDLGVVRLGGRFYAQPAMFLDGAMPNMYYDGPVQFVIYDAESVVARSNTTGDLPVMHVPLGRGCRITAWLPGLVAAADGPLDARGGRMLPVRFYTVDPNRVCDILPSHEQVWNIVAEYLVHTRR